MGFDAFAPGRREVLIHGSRLAAAQARDSGCPLLCGNLAKRHPGFIPWKIFHRRERRILVTALIEPPQAATPTTAGFKLLEPAARLQKILRQPHDLAVAVFHMPEKDVRRLLQQVPGVDLAILVDKRGVLARGKTAGQSLLLRNNNRGKSIAVIDWNSRKTRKPDRPWSLRAACRRYKPDPELAKMVDDFEKWRRAYYEKKASPNSHNTRHRPVKKH